ncbi:MAG TPA: hypothetical protein VHC69_06745 [Polyangiaceae bacterium]|nr:hypothetical protein [Polyangiaceae bacterium]
MNVKRIMLGGLAAGLVLDLLDGITNGVIFGSAWDAAYAALGLPARNPAIPAFWLSFDLGAGILIAWLYAAMRPRFGARQRTAVYAALVEWLVVHMTLYSHLADHVFPASLLLGTSACELLSAILAGLVAGRLYREEEPAAAGAKAETA